MSDHLTAITPAHLLSWGPCKRYPASRIRAIYGDRPSMTPGEILDLDDIPAKDRLWVVLRPEVMGERALRLAVCDMTERTLPLFEERHPGDARPRRAIETSRRYAVGEATADELDAARSDAWNAAFAASWTAAGDSAVAAWATARAVIDWDAAWGAVMVAARAAAGAARAATWPGRPAAWRARDAAEAAAWEAEREAQVAIVRGYLERAGVSR